MTMEREREFRVLARMIASGDLRKREIALKAIGNIPPDDVERLLSSSDIDEKTFEIISRSLLSDSIGLEEIPLTEEADKEPINSSDELPKDLAADETLTLTQRIQQMTVGEKIKLALKGDKEARTHLLKDTNREIYMGVLDNPGLKESEVEMITKNTATNTDILRAIAKNREWAANRNIMKNLVFNSKTPVEISVRFLSRMSLKDLEIIAKSRSLSMAVRTNARRLVASKGKGR